MNHQGKNGKDVGENPLPLYEEKLKRNFIGAFGASALCAQ
jgi:hypothetical protein